MSAGLGWFGIRQVVIPTLVRALIEQSAKQYYMASATRDDRNEGVVFEHEDDGSITATDLETGLARGGDTRAEALSQLAEVLELHVGGGEPITDEDLEAMRLDPDDAGDKELPDFLK
jgi:predicted RNase H-like HicB family nuclease